MFSALSSNHKAILFAVAGYTLFTVADACVKYLMQFYSVYQVVAFETFFGTLFLCALAPWLGGWRDVFRRDNLAVNLGRGGINFLINLAIVASLGALPLVTVYAITFGKPFFAALLAIPLFGQIPGKNRWIAIALGFTGILIALQPQESENIAFLLLPIVATILIAVMFLMSRALKPDTSILSIGFYPIAVSFVLTAPIAAFHFTPPAIEHLWIFVLTGGVVTAAIILISMAFHRADAALVSPFVYTQLVSGTAFGMILFGDTPDLLTLTGAAIVISSGIYLIFSERKPPVLVGRA